MSWTDLLAAGVKAAIDHEGEVRVAVHSDAQVELGQRAAERLNAVRAPHISFIVVVPEDQEKCPVGTILDEETASMNQTGGVKASERLLALFPALAFDRAVVERVLREKHFSAAAENLVSLPDTVTMNDVLGLFRHDSSVEEFLWWYIEAMTGQDVHNMDY